ncbi:hypothetical protein [Streptomyces sp. NPDC052042]|uniref:hypothetical protein n=1 Tax=Streptomyces sp. NPDC052042 TaxID=3365683 RepID=UPI0037D587F9
MNPRRSSGAVAVDVRGCVRPSGLVEAFPMTVHVRDVVGVMRALGARTAAVAGVAVRAPGC